MGVSERRAWAERIRTAAWNMLPTAHPHRFPQYHTAWHPALPRRMMQVLELPARTFIADPFCGGGVTLAEAMLMGHYAIGRDENPIAILMTRVRTRPLDTTLLANAVQRWRDAYHKQPMPDPLEREDALPHFEPRSIQCLLRAEHAWRTVAPSEPEWREWFAVALCPAIRTLSIYSTRTPKRILRRTPLTERVFEQFPAQLSTRMRAMMNYNLMMATLAPDAPPPDIQMLDCAALNKPVGAIITSPPYGISYRYDEVYTPQMVWLRIEPPCFVSPPPTPESWPRPVRDWFNYFQHVTPAPPYQIRAYADYIETLGRFARAAAHALTPNGAVAVAIADTVLHRTPLPNTQILELWLHHVGLRPLTIVQRVLPYTRIPTRRNPITGRFDSNIPPTPATETLLFYTR